MEKVSVIAITKNGIKIGLNLKKKFPKWEIWVPEKFSINDKKIKNWNQVLKFISRRNLPFV